MAPRTAKLHMAQHSVVKMTFESDFIPKNIKAKLDAIDLNNLLQNV